MGAAVVRVRSSLCRAVAWGFIMFEGDAGFRASR